MSGQPSLVTKALPNEALRPGTLEQVQFYRDKAAAGAGTYYTIDKNGVIEMVGGPGGGMISGSGTINFIPKFTPDGSTIGDSSLFDNGNIGYGTVAPNPVATFDIVSVTKGILIPRMTTAQRNAITTGATEDGLLIYNTSTEKFNFWNQTLGAWESIDTATGGDVSGVGTTDLIPRWTDGPNSILGDSIIRDNGTVAAVNRAVIAGAMFAIQGADAAGVNYTLQTYNSTPTFTFGVRNDGRVGIGTTTLNAFLNIDNAANANLAGLDMQHQGGLGGFIILNRNIITADNFGIIWETGGAARWFTGLIGNDESFYFRKNGSLGTSVLALNYSEINVGIGLNTWGTNANTVLGIANGVEPTTSPINMIQIFSVDTDDATASLGLRTEQAVVAEVVVSDATLKVRINGVQYKICLKA